MLPHTHILVFFLCIPLAATAQCFDIAKDCPEKAYLCSDKLYLALMKLQCNQTCNLCATTTTTTTVAPVRLSDTCFDLAHDCNVKRYLCEDDSYLALMKWQCNGTCGLCHTSTVTTTTTTTLAPTTITTTLAPSTDSPAVKEIYVAPLMQSVPFDSASVLKSVQHDLVSENGCVDIAYDCYFKSALCTNATYVDFMKTVCAATCGHCTREPVDQLCVDILADCPMKKYLCYVDHYVLFMEEKCAGTCSFCTTTTTSTTTTSTTTTTATTTTTVAPSTASTPANAPTDDYSYEDVDGSQTMIITQPTAAPNPAPSPVAPAPAPTYYYPQQTYYYAQPTYYQAYQPTYYQPSYQYYPSYQQMYYYAPSSPTYYYPANGTNGTAPQVGASVIVIKIHGHGHHHRKRRSTTAKP